MPWKKKTTTRRPRRRKFGRKRQTLVVRQPMIADKTIVKMRYHESISINPVTGLAGYYIFRANSINDPNQTGTGHQPMSHDEWANFYAHYTVLGSKITAQFVSQDDTPTAGTALVGVGLQRTNSPIADLDQVIERRDARTKIMTSGNARQMVTVQNWFSAKKFFGYKDIGDSAETRTGFGSNPNDEAFFNIFVAPVDNSSDVASTVVSVTIDYIVQLTERKDLLKS